MDLHNSTNSGAATAFVNVHPLIRHVHQRMGRESVQLIKIGHRYYLYRVLPRRIDETSAPRKWDAMVE